MNQDLRDRIDEYKKLDWNRFLRKDLGEYSLAEAKPSVDRVKKVLDTLVAFPDLQSLPQDYQNRLRNQLWNQIQFLDQVVQGFKNTAEKDGWVQRIRSREIEVWTEVGPVYSYLQALGVVSFSAADADKLHEAEAAAKEIVASSEKYKKAAETAEQWIKSEGRAVASSIKDKSQIFESKAKDEHTGRNVWWWLAGFAVLGLGTLGAAISFVQELHGVNDISVGVALLRISIIGALSYAAFLSYQQFNVQRRLYEAYKFKAIALATMEELIKTYADPDDRRTILNKAIEIIFSEPLMKEEKAVQQRVIDELLDVVKQKI